jgi:hypothetical protein
MFGQLCFGPNLVIKAFVVSPTGRLPKLTIGPEKLDDVDVMQTDRLAALLSPNVTSNLAQQILCFEVVAYGRAPALKPKSTYVL